MDDTGECEVIIRDGEKEDMVEVDEMIQELAAYENLTDDARLGAAELVRDGFESSPRQFWCKVAARGGRLCGYALYYRSYSTCVGRGLVLEDLYVRPGLRARGIGRRLFNAVAKEAYKQRCARLELHVLGWNTARTFYEDRGAKDLSSDWRYYRLDADALRRAAEED